MDMGDLQLTTPVAFLIFNRPETTARVFERIRQVKPRILLIIADGPRLDNKQDMKRCQEVREIVENIDWNCQVFKNYSEINLGCKKRVASGLNWVFNMVEEAIILEDDCLPDISFFRFSEELLQYYCNDQRIMSISGNNFCPNVYQTEYSYCFSRYANIWGWATWRRAWRYYSLEMDLWQKIFKDNWLNQIFYDQTTVDYWKDIFLRTYKNQINTWDYQWLFTCWTQNGLSIVPKHNLVSNIGFSIDATHTKKGNHKSSNLSTYSLGFPLEHPPFMIPNRKADEYLQKNFFNLNFWQKLRKRAKRNLKNISFYLSTLRR